MSAAHPAVTNLCKQFAERAASLDMKGKARDTAAVEWFCGALTVLKTFSAREAVVTEKWLIYCLSLRGYAAIEEALAD